MDVGNANQARHRSVFSTQGTKIEYVGGSGFITTVGRKKNTSASGFNGVGDFIACIGSFAGAIFLCWKLSHAQFFLRTISADWQEFLIVATFITLFILTDSILTTKRAQGIIHFLLFLSILLIACKAFI